MMENFKMVERARLSFEKLEGEIEAHRMKCAGWCACPFNPCPDCHFGTLTPIHEMFQELL
jgi:hypothetical protein